MCQKWRWKSRSQMNWRPFLLKTSFLSLSITRSPFFTPQCPLWITLLGSNLRLEKCGFLVMVLRYQSMDSMAMHYVLYCYYMVILVVVVLAQNRQPTANIHIWSHIESYQVPVVGMLFFFFIKSGEIKILELHPWHVFNLGTVLPKKIKVMKWKLKRGRKGFISLTNQIWGNSRVIPFSAQIVLMYSWLWV